MALSPVGNLLQAKMNFGCSPLNTGLTLDYLKEDSSLDAKFPMNTAVDCHKFLDHLLNNQKLASEISNSFILKASADPSADLDFLVVYNQLKSLRLPPMTPSEVPDMNSEDLQRKLIQFCAQDPSLEAKIEGVMTCMGKTEYAASRGNKEAAARISTEELLKIHEQMCAQFDQVLKRLEKIPEAERTQLDLVHTEKTVEALVSIQVCRQTSYAQLDIEIALQMQEATLAQLPAFNEIAQRLNTQMRLLQRLIKPSMNEAAFLTFLQELEASTKATKDCIGQLSAKVYLNQSNLLEAYSAFESFTQETASQTAKLEDYSPGEIRQYYNKYCHNPDIKTAWVSGKCDLATFLQIMLSAPQMGDQMMDQSEIEKMLVFKPDIPAISSFTVDQVVETQVALVEALELIVHQYEGIPPVIRENLKPSALMHLMLGIANAKAEEKHGLCGESMAIAAMAYGPALSTNVTFGQAYARQQELLSQTFGEPGH